MHVLLTRKGWSINIKRTYKPYNEFGLQLRNKTPKRRVKAKLREDGTKAKRRDAPRPTRWTSFTISWRPERNCAFLTIVDIWSRFSPALDPRYGENVVATLERVCREHGYRPAIRVDNGAKFISRDMDLLAHQTDVVLEFSRPRIADQQLLYRVVQRQVSGGVPEYPMVLTLDDARQNMEH